jgi:hypothetical protein
LHRSSIIISTTSSISYVYYFHIGILINDFFLLLCYRVAIRRITGVSFCSFRNRDRMRRPSIIICTSSGILLFSIQSEFKSIISPTIVGDSTIKSRSLIHRHPISARADSYSIRVHTLQRNQ